MADINYTASTPKKQYTRRIGDHGFLGADFSTAPIFASDRRFRDLKNVWKDYKSGSGVAIETVPGYRLIGSAITGAVNGFGIFTVTEQSPAVLKWKDNNPTGTIIDAVGTWIIAHIGTMLLVGKEENISNGNTDDNPTVGLVVDDQYYTTTLLKMPNKRSTIIQQGNGVLIMTGGKIFRLTLLTIAMALACGISLAFNADCPSPFIMSDLDSVVSSGNNVYDFSGYVPTTYIDGDPYEQKNMLNAHSKEVYNVTTSSANETAVCSFHEKVRAGLSYDSMTGTTVVVPKANIDAVFVDGVEIARSDFYCNQEEDYDPFAIIHPGLVYRVRVVVASAGSHKIEVVYKADPASFTSYQSYEDYKDRKTFNEGNPDYSGTAYAAIAGCTICATFDERVFLSGNPKLPNTVFYSQRDLTGYNNPTYFGVLNYNNLGTSNAPITAMIPSANALYVLKDDSATDPTMYVLSGLSTEKDLIPRIYTVESGLPGIGCKGAACNFLDDIVFMSRNGVIGIDKQAVNLERTLGDRSVLINGKLLLEDVTQAVFAEAEGYLWCLFKNNGHLYLADSRTYTQGAGYEWYYIESVGSWTGDADLYTYSNAYLNGAQSADLEDKSSASARAETEDGEIADYSPGTKYKVVACGTAYEQADHASKVTVYLEYTEERTWNDRHDDYDVSFTANTDGAFVVIVPTGATVDGVATYYQIVPTGEKVGGTFHPATCMVASNDRIFFGTDNGDLLTFNNDKRGVQAESEIAVRAEDNPNGNTDIYEANRYPFLLRPEWYSFCGHRIESFVETSDDDGGIGNVTKDTVRRSAVVDMKAMLGSSWTITVYTDRDNGQPATVATGAMDDATQTTFEGVNFNGGDHVITQIRERSRKWVHKRYRVESNGFRCPFGLYRITYNFEINGRIK